MRIERLVVYGLLLITTPFLIPLVSSAQEVPQPGVLNTEKKAPEPKRLFGIIPNNRTSESLQEYVPLTKRQKFKVASDDSFDRGTILLAAVFAGGSQLSRSDPSFGNGVQAYAHYFGTSYGDFVIGNFMTEAIFPIALHQDPRYFRRGTGTAWSRIGYCVGQSFWTHNDSGKGQFNYSEVFGNSAAVAISAAYYPEGRTAHDATVKLGTQIGVDTGANLLKEFAPEITRAFTRKH